MRRLRGRVHRPVVQRRAPVRRALEHREVPDRLGDLGDRLDRGRAGADHRDALAREAHRPMRPRAGMVGLAAKALDARDGRHGRRRQGSDRGDQEPRPRAPAVVALDLPLVGGLVIGDRLYPAIELDVAAQVELVGDEVAVAQRLRLRREVLAPLPLAQDLVGEGVAVGPALGIEPRPGVAVPVPGAAHAVAGLEHPHAQAEPAQPVELVHAGDPGADDDDVIGSARLRRGRGSLWLRFGRR